MGNKQNKGTGPPRSQSESDGLRNGNSKGGGPEADGGDGRGKKGGKVSKNNSGKAAITQGTDERDGATGRKRQLSCPAPGERPTVGGRAGEQGGGGGGGGSGPELEVKIYRSYSNLTESRHSTSVLHDPAHDASNIKVINLFNTAFF